MDVMTDRNTYALTYEHDFVASPGSPTTMTVSVNPDGLQKFINANDYLNKIEIYDATTFGLIPTVANYTVSATFIDTSKTA